MTLVLPAIALSPNAPFKIEFDSSTPGLSQPSTPVKGVLLENYSGYILTVAGQQGTRSLPPWQGNYFPVAPTGTVSIPFETSGLQSSNNPNPVALPTLVTTGDKEPIGVPEQLVPTALPLSVVSQQIQSGSTATFIPSQNAIGVVVASTVTPNAALQTLGPGLPVTVINLPLYVLSAPSAGPQWGVAYAPIFGNVPLEPPGPTVQFNFPSNASYFMWEVDSYIGIELVKAMT